MNYESLLLHEWIPNDESLKNECVLLCKAAYVVQSYPWKMFAACSYPRKPLLNVRWHGNCSCTDKGMVRSDRSKPALIFFFTARVHTTKSSIKILAANTHRKYFLKIGEVTHFSVLGTACIRGFTTLRSAHNSRVSLDRFNIRLTVLSVAYCFALLGVYISPKGLAGYNIGNVQQFLKNTCNAY
jgi:hypothetical protein